MTENRQNQLVKLQALEEKGVKTGSKTSFQDLVVCSVGAPIKEHYPKVKVKGVVQKDADGNDKRSQQSDGFTYTFSQFGTANKVMAVLPQKYNLELLTAYKLSGLGYQMRQANMLYLDENVKLTVY
ncbi:MAG: hypothetical protein M3Z87_06980 [Lactobacillus sp.]|nr:hypothetical protein [Lactobacillus sp.]